MDTRQVMVHYATKYLGDFTKIINAIYGREKATKDVVEANYEGQELGGVKISTALDVKGYPSWFRDKTKGIEEPPVVMFYKGNISVLNNRNAIHTVLVDNNLSENDQSKITDIIKACRGETLVVVARQEAAADAALFKVLNFGKIYCSHLVVVVDVGIRHTGIDMEAFGIDLVIGILPAEVDYATRSEATTNATYKFAVDIGKDCIIGHVGGGDAVLNEAVKYALVTHKLDRGVRSDGAGLNNNLIDSKLIKELNQEEKEE